MEKPKLFLDYKEFLTLFFLLATILVVRLLILYGDYKEFISKPFYYTQATVLLQYTKHKNGKSYRVLQLKDNDGRRFYTTTHIKRDLKHTILRVKLYPNNSISFFDYLGVYFIKSKIKIEQKQIVSTKERLLNQIALQHQKQELTSFYQAIFLATPLASKLREKIASLGVSHLVALSGFHLTILWGVIYGLLSLLYKPLQQRYFPYRMMLLDMGIVTLLFLGIYLWFVDFPPSLMRSYVMLLIGWVVLLLGVELMSFELLGFVVMLLLASFPNLIVSIGFHFSVMGVFYIYLLIYWNRNIHNIRYVLSIPVGTFLLMLPLVHGVFAIVSPWQLLSPLLSLAFMLFYPLVILLHLIGYGGLLDRQLLYLFELPTRDYEHIVPLWMLSIYLLLSFFSMKSLRLFQTTTLFAFGYALYIFAYLY